MAIKVFKELRKKAYSCPPKQHIRPKQIRKNFTLFAHDDTWTLSANKISGWGHFRGFEKHIEPPSQTKFNVYYLMYDYAQRNNIVISTIYWERTDPGKSGNSIAKRATSILIKQLQKIG